MEKRKVIVIGAGPAGLAACLGALKEGASVLVLEHMEKAGKKLLLTGNGCCNFTNTEVSPVHYHGDVEIIESVLKSCSWRDLKSLFEELGVPSAEEHYRFETCGYLYPADRKAESVRDALLGSCIRLGADFLYRCHIASVTPDEGKGFCVKTDLGEFSCDRLIFATGSNAVPSTGSDSSIYPVLKALGIRQKMWLPALCAMKSPDPVLRELSGLRCDAKAVLFDETEDTRWETPIGEVQFREHYVSGLPVMQLSRYAAIGIKNGHEMKLSLHLLKANNKDFRLPLEELELKVSGTEGFEKCVCCSGGVGEGQIDPETLQCRAVPGIFFAGELMDVDGDCGGFNLHFAFASGLLAGRNAAR